MEQEQITDVEADSAGELKSKVGRKKFSLKPERAAEICCFLYEEIVSRHSHHYVPEDAEALFKKYSKPSAETSIADFADDFRDTVGQPEGYARYEPLEFFKLVPDLLDKLQGLLSRHFTNSGYEALLANVRGRLHQKRHKHDTRKLLVSRRAMKAVESYASSAGLSSTEYLEMVLEHLQVGLRDDRCKWHQNFLASTVWPELTQRAIYVLMRKGGLTLGQAKAVLSKVTNRPHSGISVEPKNKPPHAILTIGAGNLKALAQATGLTTRKDAFDRLVQADETFKPNILAYLGYGVRETDKWWLPDTVKLTSDRGQADLQRVLETLRAERDARKLAHASTEDPDVPKGSGDTNPDTNTDTDAKTSNPA